MRAPAQSSVLRNLLLFPASSQALEWIAGSGADAVRGENLRFFPELRHRVAKMLRVLAYDSGGAALPELLRPGVWPSPANSHTKVSAAPSGSISHQLCLPSAAALTAHQQPSAPTL